MGHRQEGKAAISRHRSGAIFALGLGVLALAVGMPWWLHSLASANLSTFGANAAARMQDGWQLVPLTASFAFISPAKLAIAIPVLALIPVAL